VIIKDLKITLSGAKLVISAVIKPITKSGVFETVRCSNKVVVINKVAQISREALLPNFCGNPLIPEVRS
jgi:hypothetical protein